MRHTLRAALVKTRATGCFRFALHQPLQHELPKLPQKVPVRVLLSQFEQCHPIVGHRGQSPWFWSSRQQPFYGDPRWPFPPPPVTPLLGTLPAIGPGFEAVAVATQSQWDGNAASLCVHRGAGAVPAVIGSRRDEMAPSTQRITRGPPLRLSLRLARPSGPPSRPPARDPFTGCEPQSAYRETPDTAVVATLHPCSCRGNQSFRNKTLDSAGCAPIMRLLRRALPGALSRKLDQVICVGACADSEDNLDFRRKHSSNFTSDSRRAVSVGRKTNKRS